MLEIRALGLHWLGPEPTINDLCAHAALEVRFGGELLLEVPGDGLAVSTGALHLLRTLDRDHTAEEPIADHLVPHCGHFMCVDPDTGAVCNVGCLEGANWWVVRLGEHVRLTFAEGREVTVPAAAWGEAVARFSDQVAAFYTASLPRVPGDEHDATWFPLLQREWAERRAQIAAAS